MQFNYKSYSSIFIILVLIHLIFFSIKIYIGNFFLEDSYEYYKLAENIKTHFTFYSGDLNSTIHFENYTKRPPLYGLFLLVFSFLLKSQVTVLLIQNAFSILSIILTLKIFENYFKEINTKLYIGLIIVSVSQFVYANFLMSEILFQFLITLLCYSFHKTIETKQLKYVFYSQIIIILLYLTKPIFYLFVIPNFLVCFWLTKKIVSKSYLLSLIPILFLLIYSSWNKQRTGSYEFSSIQNINLKNYNLKYFHTNKYGEDYAIKTNYQIDSIANTTTVYSEKQQLIKMKSLNYIKKDLFSYLWFHIKGTTRMFIDPGRFDLHNFFNFKNSEAVGFLDQINKGGLSSSINYFKTQPLLILILIPFLLIFNILKIIGFLLYCIKNYKSTSPMILYALFIIAYISILTGPIGASRFLVPIIPLYCIFASRGLTLLIPKLLNK